MIKSATLFNIHPLMDKIPGNKILDYMYRTRLDENLIPQYFNGRVIFQSFSSFQQNNLRLSKLIRKYVSQSITTTRINSIGGESYFYDITKKGHFYTNSNYIIKDAKFNGYLQCNLIDYNKDKIVLSHLDTIVNLSKLNKNILLQINDSISNKIIIINCHHQDFWKKRGLMGNYMLCSRKQFIDYTSGYFITVSIFLRKKAFVPLGGNCSVSYHLKNTGLRVTAYPFDWCKIKLGQIKTVFQKNFKDYHQVNIKKFSELHENSFIIYNNYCHFAHEVKRESQLDEFTKKLKRRIIRLIQLENPIFIRNEIFVYKDKKIYTNYWKKIIKILDSIYHNNYKIILISNINPELPNIKWIKYQSKNKGWKNEDLPWNTIFQM